MIDPTIAERARASVDAFCAGASSPQNNLEERLDMIATQLSVIALELHELNESLKK